jgi:hypothetical protein
LFEPTPTTPVPVPIEPDSSTGGVELSFPKQNVDRFSLLQGLNNLRKSHQKYIEN